MGLEWEDRAACRDVDPDVMYPDSAAAIPTAKRVCAGCPVIGQCLAWALAVDERFGVWGGTSPDERAHYRRTGHWPARRAPCGTVSAAQRHRRRREPVDEACRRAQNAAARAARARRVTA